MAVGTHPSTSRDQGPGPDGRLMEGLTPAAKAHLPTQPPSARPPASASKEGIHGLRTTTDKPDASDASLLPSDLQRGRPSPENQVDRETCLA